MVVVVRRMAKCVKSKDRGARLLGLNPPPSLYWLCDHGQAASFPPASVSHLKNRDKLLKQ